jgi:hypothetical protein
LNNFSNSESGYLRLSISEYNPQHKLEKDTLICELPNGFIVKVTIEDFNHNVDNDIVIQNLKSYDSNFVNEQTEERIRKFIGYPVIGRVVNQSDLIEILKLPALELESLRFD